MKKIVICVVNYHNAQEVVSYVNTLFSQTCYNDIEIVITDNSNSDSEYNYLKQYLPRNIFIYQVNMNLGYINGINYGLCKYLETNDLPEWIVISNTDISYEDNLFYETLLELYPNGYNSVIAPCIYSTENNLYQNPLVINRYSKLKMFILTYVFKFHVVERIFDYLNKIKNQFQKRKTELLPNQEIYIGHGACLIINKSYFIKGGNLEYKSFLFGEELFIAEQVKKNGGKVYFDNRLKVKHYEHTTIKKEKRKLINKYYFDSMKYLYKEFY